MKCFRNSPFFYEIKFFLLVDFLKGFSYEQCDKMIEAIESHFLISQDLGILANNINPILVAMLLLHFLEELKSQYSIFTFRIDQLIDVIKD